MFLFFGGFFYRFFCVVFFLFPVGFVIPEGNPPCWLSRLRESLLTPLGPQSLVNFCVCVVFYVLYIVVVFVIWVRLYLSNYNSYMNFYEARNKYRK